MSNPTKIYKIRFRLSIPDPEMPQPRYHTTLFIQTPLDTLNGTGTTHHVTGDLVTGMVYQKRFETSAPDNDEMFFSKELLGYIKDDVDEEGIEEVLKTLEPPGKQKRYNHKTGRTEQFKPEGGFYEVGEGRPAMRKCTEWIEEQAIPALRESGVLIAEK
ncbi:hypothetical protein HYFRA_00012785 [Hymenoscyphus fraxineus]|uniref:Uncharacterized protein n=1 Tax=Hymenoscyphus fraxineus TaxID=746836 RepID=A0A9N9L4P1_9HELO|nr:hypothetical protein HYFRA_00012785 [Hymenoscyphus fraxineus]